MYQLYPFNIKYISAPGKYSIPFDELDPSNYGIIYEYAERTTPVKLYAITYYDNGMYKETSVSPGLYIRLNTNGEINANILSEAFEINEDIQGDGAPKYIEIVMIPLKCCPIKWMITVT